MNKPVSYSLAKLLRDKSFNELCDKGYFNERCESFGLYKDYNVTQIRRYRNSDLPITEYIPFYPRTFNYTAPTIADVIVWLHEKHLIWINVNVTIDSFWYFEIFNLKDKRNSEIIINDEEITDFHQSPTEAYEKAIEYCLNKIVK